MPSPRKKLEETKRSLLSHQEQLRLLQMEVVLREPVQEALDELRGFFQEIVARD